jgi:hypothetical protein
VSTPVASRREGGKKHRPEGRFQWARTRPRVSGRHRLAETGTGSVSGRRTRVARGPQGDAKTAPHPARQQGRGASGSNQAAPVLPAKRHGSAARSAYARMSGLVSTSGSCHSSRPLVFVLDRSFVAAGLRGKRKRSSSGVAALRVLMGLPLFHARKRNQRRKGTT